MNIGVGGVILLVLIALLLFGPNKLPELGRAVGRTLKEFKAGANEIMDTNDKKKEEAAPIEVQAEPLERANKRLPD
ncbi:Sec-independent protein translocase protein TatA [Paenibacillus montaniterrae]|uniref:Sec-independent protein translocase protein TatA n=1 Tax=Paenibacillus montaniterrae TaxID=429341 RepID=A0A920CWX4_9BACL|nr:twin-arginine translocase TatA/TatE family subunit [Paenibacillus montaniterrae]GIP16341.1 Sec-independent protein translocase protein TatA [Paenibacillus montaniterrae]